MNRRRFLSLAGTSIAGIALVGCGSKEANPEVVVTKIPNVAGAPPTLAPNATPPNTSGAAAGGASPAAGGGGSAPTTFTLEAHDPYDWSTKAFTIAQGGTISIKNTGVLPHDFSVDALKIAQPLDPGKTVEVKIPDDAKPGKYQYYCNVPGHKEAGMVGEMTVVAKGAGGGQAQQPAGGGQAGGAATFTLEAHDPYNWSTKKFTIEQGGTVTVINKGVLPHDFSVDALKIAQPLDPGKTYEVKIPDDAKPGDYEYYCNVPGHKEAGMFGTMTVVAKGAGGGAAQQPAGGGQAPAQAGGGQAGGAATFKLEAHDPYNWSTKKFTIEQGGTITVTNTGVLPHDFSVDALKIAQPLDPGKTVEVKVPDDAKPGDYEFYCNVPGHKEAGMFGTMTVVAKGAGGAATSAPAQQGQAGAPVQTEATPPSATGPAGSPAATPSTSGGTMYVPVEAGDNYFKPNAFTIPANTEVIVTITNVGQIPHDFVIDQLKVQSKLVGPGESTTVKIKAPAGKYEYYCAQPGHKQLGMWGTMTVEAGAAAASPAASPAAASPAAAASPIASPAAGGGATSVTVDMGELFFKPNKFTIPANTDVTVTLKNIGALPHDFNIDKKNNPSDPNVHSEVVQAGKDTTVKLKLAAGNWYFYCNQPGHEAAGMHGIVTAQ